jgi:hypothetical protein
MCGDQEREQSALLLPVPAAEAAVGAHRARLDASARDGVPAHLTVLYPFLPPALIGDAVLASLRRLFAGFPAFPFTLDRAGAGGPGRPAPPVALAGFVSARMSRVRGPRSTRPGPSVAPVPHCGTVSARRPERSSRSQRVTPTDRRNGRS